MAKKCENCKSWTNTKDKYDFKELGFYIGHCSNKHFVYIGDGSEKMLKDGLGYWDRESIDAGFNTGPDFCCKFFELKKRKGYSNG